MPDHTSSIAFMIKRVSQTFKQLLDQHPDQLPLTQAQAGVMLLITMAQDQGKRISPSDLETQLHLSRPTVTGILQRLESRGYIQMQSSPEDKRFKHLRATEAFMERRIELEENLARQEARLMAGFTPQEEQQLRSYLNRMLHNLKEGGSSL